MIRTNQPAAVAPPGSTRSMIPTRRSSAPACSTDLHASTSLSRLADGVDYLTARAPGDQPVPHRRLRFARSRPWT